MFCRRFFRKFEIYFQSSSEKFLYAPWKIETSQPIDLAQTDIKRRTEACKPSRLYKLEVIFKNFFSAVIQTIEI